MGRQKIGITYTTRNRSHVLDLCLESMQNFLPKNYDYEFWVIDDASDHPERNNYEEVLKKYPFVKYHKNEVRRGIAGSKNECLKHVKDCDYVFLLDDDVFFIDDGVYDFFINNSQRTGIQHFLYQTDAGWLGFKNEKNGILEFHNSAGVMMFMTKRVIETVGGYDTRMTYYAYEHSQFTMRIHAAGLMNGYDKYCCPKGAGNYVFSLDLDMNCGGKKVPHRPDFHQDGKYEFYSSIEGENVQDYINFNSQYLYSIAQIYREIE